MNSCHHNLKLFILFFMTAFTFLTLKTICFADNYDDSIKMGISRSTEAAIEANLNHRLKKLNYDIRVLNVEKARAKFGPVLTVESKFQNKSNNPFDKKNSVIYNQSNDNTSFELYQPLFNFGYLRNNLGSQEAKMHAMRFELIQDSIELEEKVVIAYMNILKYNHKLRAINDGISQANNQLLLLEKDVKEGKRPNSILMRWKVLLSNFQQEKADLQYNIIDNKLIFNSLLEREPSVEVNLLNIGSEEYEIDYFRLVDEAGQKGIEGVMEAMFQYAVFMSPLSNQKNYEIIASEKDVKTTRADKMPKIGFNPKVSNDGGSPSKWEIGITAKMDVFNVSQWKDIDIKQKELQKTKLGREIYLRDLKFNIQNLFSKTANALWQVDSRLKQVDEGREYLKNIMEKYALGEFDDLTLIDAFTSYYENRSALIDSLYDYYIDRQQLRTIIGYSDFLQTPTVEEFHAHRPESPTDEMLFEGGEIYSAVIKGDVDRVKALLQKNPSLASIENDYKWTPLHWAAFKGNYEICLLLLDYNKGINTPAVNGYSPLFLAATNGYSRIVELFLQHGGNPNISSKSFNWTPLMRTSKKGYYKTAEMLLKAGADVNAKSMVGWTALHNAVESGHFNIVKMLVDAGADLHSKNRAENTPLDLAKLNEHKEIVDYLENLMNQEQQEQIEINQDPDTQIQL